MLREVGILKVSGKFFRRLLHAYPYPHRQRFSEEMSQVFREVSRTVYFNKGLTGLLGLWLTTSADLLKTALEERLKEITNMTQEKFIRLGSWSLMLSGVVSFVVFGSEGLANTAFGRSSSILAALGVLVPSIPLLFAIGFAALRRRFQTSLGDLGKVGLIGGIVFSVIGFLWLLFSIIVYDEGVQWFGLLFSFMTAATSMVLFGIDALGKSYIPRWGSVPLISGLLPLAVLTLTALGAGFGLTESNSGLFSGLALGGFAIGMFLIGYVMQSDSKTA